MLSRQLAAAKRADYATWLATWDRASRERFEDLAAAGALDPQRLFDQRARALATARPVLRSWVQLSHQVFLVYELIAETGNASSLHAVGLAASEEGWRVRWDLEQHPVREALETGVTEIRHERR